MSMYYEWDSLKLYDQWDVVLYAHEVFILTHRRDLAPSILSVVHRHQINERWVKLGPDTMTPTELQTAIVAAKLEYR